MRSTDNHEATVRSPAKARRFSGTATLALWLAWTPFAANAVAREAQEARAGEGAQAKDATEAQGIAAEAAALAEAADTAKAAGALNAASTNEAANPPSELERVRDELVDVWTQIDASRTRERALRPALEARLADEGSLPEEVIRIQKERAYLEEKARQAMRSLAEMKELSKPVVLELLEAKISPSAFESLLPLALEVAAGDPRLDEILLRAARELRPCPPRVLEALAARSGDRGREQLLELAVEERDLAAFVAAAARGDAKAFAALAEACEAPDADLREAALRAMARVDPPASDPGGLEDFILQRLETSRSLELRSALVAYLGRWRREAQRGTFEALAANAALEDPLRLAAIGALGRLEAGSRDLFLQLIAEGSPPAIRRGAIHALASSRAVDAVPHLIELLAEPEWAETARRALTSLVGQDLGRQSAAWQRWWNARAESGDSTG